MRASVSRSLSGAKLGQRLRGDRPGRLGQPVELAVVEDHDAPVRSPLHVAFDREVAGDGGLGGRQGVLDPPGRPVMVSAMGDRPRGQPVDV